MNLIAYYRVSTDRQGQSGLGLDAQRAKVQQFAADRRHQIVGEITEVQSGKDDSRPELARALTLARASGAGIIVAKLDRLARSAGFLDTILRSGVQVLFCDLPDIPPGPTGVFIVQVMASIAQLEAGMIAERTRSALAQAKANGKVLGGFRGTAASPKAREASAEARARRADEFALRVAPEIRRARAVGQESPDEIAAWLRAHDVPTPSGKGAWSHQAVQRTIARINDYHQRQLAAAQREKELAEL